MKAIDFHTHAFPDQLAEKALSALHQTSGDYQALHDGTVSGLLASMDRAGIERAVIASIATKPEQVPKIIDWSLEIRNRRIIPFASLHPRGRDFKKQARRIKAVGLKGVKLHPMYQDFDLADGKLFPLYEAVADNDLILLLHAGWDIAFPGNLQAAPGKILAVHLAFPELKIVASHLGGWRMWEEVARDLAGRTVYLETSFAAREAPAEVFARILESHSPDHILFGTDSPWLDQKEELQTWLDLDLPPELKEKILFRNARRLLGLDD